MDEKNGYLKPIMVTIMKLIGTIITVIFFIWILFGIIIFKMFKYLGIDIRDTKTEKIEHNDRNNRKK